MFPAMGNMGNMTLYEWFRLTKADEAEFAKAVGSSAGAVRKWRYAQRMPRPQAMKAIAEATDGAVTAIDFYPAPEGAE